MHVECPFQVWASRTPAFGGHLVAEGSLQRRRHGQQGVSEPVGGPGSVGSEVGVSAVEDPQPRQQLVAGGDPAQPVGASAWDEARRSTHPGPSPASERPSTPLLAIRSLRTSCHMPPLGSLWQTSAGWRRCGDEKIHSTDSPRPLWHCLVPVSGGHPSVGQAGINHREPPADSRLCGQHASRDPGHRRLPESQAHRQLSHALLATHRAADRSTAAVELV